MGIGKYIKRYEEYESKELARRLARKKRISAYRQLASKKHQIPKVKKEFDSKAYTKAIGNPYSVKFPKAKKVLTKVKKKAGKKRKKIIVYVN